ncbi:hypothetical protein JXA80_06300 [bacterium]|nr:hypothetical protein [candidate division CSSED10-310 bacterium]
MKYQHALMALVVSCVAVVVPSQAQQVIWIETMGICNTASIQIPVHGFTGSTLVNDLGFTVTFDSSLLSFSGIAPSGRTADWDSVMGTESVPGQVVITASAGTLGTPIPAYTRDRLLTMDFTCAACNPGSSSTFVFSALTGDIAAYTATDGAFTWYDGCGVTLPAVTGCIDPVSVMVTLVDSNPVDDFYMEITYDPTMLSFMSVSQTGTLTDDWVYFIGFEVSGAPGTVILIGSTQYGGSPIPGGTGGNLAELLFAVTCSTCNENDQSTIAFADLSGDVVDHIGTNGTFTYQCGTPGSDTLVIGNTSGGPSAHVLVPISFDTSPDAVDAFGLDVPFCTDMLAFNGCMAGDLTGTFTLLDGYEATPGIITIGGYDVNPIPAGSSGTVAILDFTVTCYTCLNNDTCTLQATNLVDDIVNWETGEGIFTYIAPVLPVTDRCGRVVLIVVVSALMIASRRR